MVELPKLRRERDLGAIIGDGFALLAAHWSRMAMTVAPAVLVGMAISLLEYGVRDDVAPLIVVSLLSVPVSIIAYQLVSAAAIAQVDAYDRGRPMAAGEALDAAQARFGDVVSASLRSTGIIVLLGITIIGIPFAIMRAIRWTLIVQSIMLDNQTGESALAYSAALIEGRWWLTFGRLLATGLVVGLPALILSQIILAAIPGVVGVILAELPYLLLLPFGIITGTLIFFDYKQRKEPAV
jgi:hypothetical protein